MTGDTLNGKLKMQDARTPLRGARRRVITVGAFIVAGPLLMSGCAGKEPIQITGFIQSSKTDDNDIPVDGYLWDGTTQYNLEHNDKLEGLLENVDRKVKAEGQVREDWDGKKWIEIESMKIVD